MKDWIKAEFEFEGEIVWLLWKEGDRKAQAVAAPSREMLKAMRLRITKTAILPEHVISDLRRRILENASIEGPEILAVVPFVGVNRKIADLLQRAATNSSQALFDFAVGLSRANGRFVRF